MASQEVAYICITLFNFLFQSGAFEIADEYLEEMIDHIDKMSPQYHVSVLRSCTCAQEKLPHYQAYYEAAVQSIKKKGENPKAMLKGAEPDLSIVYEEGPSQEKIKRELSRGKYKIKEGETWGQAVERIWKETNGTGRYE